MSRRTRSHSSTGHIRQRDASAVTRRIREDFNEMYERRLLSGRAFDPRKDRRLFTPDRTLVNRPFDEQEVHPIFNLKRSVRKNQQVVPQRKVTTHFLYDYKNPFHWIAAPDKTMVCARRAIRRSVLFAFGKRSGGGRGRRRPDVKRDDRNYNQESIIKCRR